MEQKAAHVKYNLATGKNKKDFSYKPLTALTEYAIYKSQPRAVKSMEVQMTNFARELALIKHDDATIPNGLRIAKHKLIGKTIEIISEIERIYASNILIIKESLLEKDMQNARENILQQMINSISLVEDDTLQFRTNFLENRVQDLQLTRRERELAQTIEQLLMAYDMKITEHKIKIHTLEMIVRLHGDKAIEAQTLIEKEKNSIENLQYLTDRFKEVASYMRQRKLQQKTTSNNYSFKYECQMINNTIYDAKQYNFGY